MERYKRGIVEKGKNYLRKISIYIFEKIVASKKIDADKDIYYIIRRDGHGAGFFSNYLWVLSHVIYAEEHNMIPVVDMKYYPTLYSENKVINRTKNAWNYYFEDVSSVSLHEAYASGNFVLGDFIYRTDCVERFCGKYGLPSPEAVRYYFPIINNHFRIRADVLRELEKDWNNYFGTEDNMIAVHYRGTDMKRVDLGLHYQPAAVDNYINALQKLIDETGIQKVFLASDEEDVIEQFKAVFGEQLVSYNAYRADKDNELVGIHDSKAVRNNHKYLLGYEVLRDAYTLSKGAALVCGYSNVSNVAILWNGNRYKKIVIVN